jgi:D-alanyl-lipoteichoic acid acyltransferase DltB (MBOAT superfamily)
MCLNHQKNRAANTPLQIMIIFIFIVFSVIMVSTHQKNNAQKTHHLHNAKLICYGMNRWIQSKLQHQQIQTLTQNELEKKNKYCKQ